MAGIDRMINDQRIANGQAPLVHLQGVGKVEGKPAGDLVIGDVAMWNGGGTSEVVNVEPIGSSMVAITYRGAIDFVGTVGEYTRRHRRTFLVGYPASRQKPATPAVDVVTAEVRELAAIWRHRIAEQEARVVKTSMAVDAAARRVMEARDAREAAEDAHRAEVGHLIALQAAAEQQSAPAPAATPSNVLPLFPVPAEIADSDAWIEAAAPAEVQTEKDAARAATVAELDALAAEPYAHRAEDAAELARHGVAADVAGRVLDYLERLNVQDTENCRRNGYWFARSQLFTVEQTSSRRKLLRLVALEALTPGARRRQGPGSIVCFLEIESGHLREHNGYRSAGRRVIADLSTEAGAERLAHLGG